MGMRDDYVHTIGRFCLSLLAQSCSCSPCGPLVMLHSDAPPPPPQVINYIYTPSHLNHFNPCHPHLVTILNLPFSGYSSNNSLFDHPFQPAVPLLFPLDPSYSICIYSYPSFQLDPPQRLFRIFVPVPP